MVVVEYPDSSSISLFNVLGTYGDLQNTTCHRRAEQLLSGNLLQVDRERYHGCLGIDT
jgi:hypothetical protein